MLNVCAYVCLHEEHVNMTVSLCKSVQVMCVCAQHVYIALCGACSPVWRCVWGNKKSSKQAQEENKKTIESFLLAKMKYLSKPPTAELTEQQMNIIAAFKKAA